MTNFEKEVIKRLDQIDKKLSSHDKKFDKVINKLLDHEKKFDQIIEDKFAEMRNFNLTHFDSLYGQLEKLRQEYTLINNALTRMEKAASERKDVGADELKQVKDRSLELLRRVELLEAKVGV